jgi:hypothetical protein
MTKISPPLPRRDFIRWAALVLPLLATAGRAGAEDEAEAERRRRASESLKERLSDKASDEQRVDDCKVPPERRGPKKRPDCAPAAAQRREPSRSALSAPSER